MRPLLVLLMIVALGLGATACGSTSGATGSASPQAGKRDRDNDGDNNDDDAHILNYGHAPGATEREELTSLVRSYYAAGAAEDGVKACSMLYSLISETVAEEYGRIPALRGSSCATVMAKLFRERHHLLVGESATLKVYATRVKGERALTLLTFAMLPEVRQMLERRVGATWKIAALSDNILE
jgi:hypothetical protein